MFLPDAVRVTALNMMFPQSARFTAVAYSLLTASPSVRQQIDCKMQSIFR